MAERSVICSIESSTVSHHNFRDGRSDRGQAATEFALTVPLLLIAVIGAVQVFVVLVDRIHLVHVTRDAARAASVADDPEQAAEAVIDRSLPGRTVSVSVDTHDDVVRVEIVLVNPTDVPIVGRFLPDVELRESLSMFAESLVDP